MNWRHLLSQLTLLHWTRVQHTLSKRWKHLYTKGHSAPPRIHQTSWEALQNLYDYFISWKCGLNCFEITTDTVLDYCKKGNESSGIIRWERQDFWTNHSHKIPERISVSSQKEDNCLNIWDIINFLRRSPMNIYNPKARNFLTTRFCELLSNDPIASSDLFSQSVSQSVNGFLEVWNDGIRLSLRKNGGCCKHGNKTLVSTLRKGISTTWPIIWSWRTTFLAVRSLVLHTF